MDESGRKVLIGILIAIAAGVSLYFLIDDAPTRSGGVSTQVQNDPSPNSSRPEGDGIISPEARVVSRAMIGTWKSADDPKFTREFREDGTVLDRYEGGESATREGIWGVFTADMAATGTTTGLAPGVVYLQMTINDVSVYFSVIRAADTLEFAYLEGGQLNFVRAQ